VNTDIESAILNDGRAFEVRLEKYLVGSDREIPAS
jgi:hypothetical protein